MSATPRLKATHSLKATLRDSLNRSEPTAWGNAQSEVMGPPTMVESPFEDEDDDDLFSPEWTCGGDIDSDNHEPQHTRQRCDSAASIATVKPGPGESNPHATELSAKKRGKRSSTKPRVASSGGRRSLKRSQSSRNLRPDEEGTDDSNADWFFEDVPVSKLPKTSDDVAWFDFPEPSKSRRGPPAAEADTLADFIAQEEDSAKMLDRLYIPVSSCGVKVRQRFDVSINFKTRHVDLWDIANFKTVHTVMGVVYVMDARPYIPGQLVDQPIRSVSVDWRTVESDCKQPRITDQALYETSLGEERTNGRCNVPEISVAKGLYTAKKWEWVAPGTPGTCRGGGWMMRFWVPVPLSLLKDRAGGIASFVHASVTVIDDDEDELITTHAQTIITLESLRRGRDMPGHRSLTIQK